MSAEAAEEFGLSRLRKLRRRRVTFFALYMMNFSAARLAMSVLTGPG